MTPELAQAIAQLRQARIAEGQQLHRHAPEVAKAIDRLLQIVKKATR